MGNALQNKGHANRRPAVCKKSVPTNCPLGEIVLESLFIEANFPSNWTLQGHWLTPNTDATLNAEAVLTSTTGTPEQPTIPITNQTPFTFIIDSPSPGVLCVVMIEARTPDGCLYRGTTSIFFPNPPLE